MTYVWPFYFHEKCRTTVLQKKVSCVSLRAAICLSPVRSFVSQSVRPSLQSSPVQRKQISYASYISFKFLVQLSGSRLAGGTSVFVSFLLTVRDSYRCKTV